MPIEFSGFPIEFTPTLLSSGYTSGDVLFTPEKITNLNYRGSIPAVLRQLGIFWDIANAPEMSLYLFHSEPEGWGKAGDVPAPTLDARASLLGEWDVSDAAGQGYATMMGSNGLLNSYTIVTSPIISALNSDNQEGWLTALINEDTSVNLSDQLKITFITEK